MPDLRATRSGPRLQPGRAAAGTRLLALAFLSALISRPVAPSPPAEGAGRLLIPMEDCQATRRATLRGLPEGSEELLKDPEGQKKFAEKILEALNKQEKLVKRGRVKVGRQSFDLYLPEPTTPYTTKNTGKSDSDHENESTLISIDADGDGVLTSYEGWFSNLPVRLEDRMYEVAAIASDGSTVELRPSRAPLSGLVVGWPCPPFSYTTSSGKKVNLNTYRGKALLLDIWSITRHNCIKEFPLVQRVQERYGKKKLEVLLLSVDRKESLKKDPEEEAKRIFEKFKVEWPNVYVPRSWEGLVRTFNAKGYGLVLVDPRGIVRGIDIHAEQAEALLKEIYPDR